MPYYPPTRTTPNYISEFLATDWVLGIDGLYAITFVHNFNTNGVIVEVWDETSLPAQLAWVQNIVHVDSNTTKIQIPPSPPDYRFKGFVVINTSGSTSGAGLGSSWTTLTKTATQSVTNSDVLTADNTMSFTPVANTNYRIRGVIFFDTTIDTADFKYTFIGPAAPTLFRGEIQTAATNQAPAETVVIQAYPGVVPLVGSDTNGGYMRFDFILHNGANSTVFQFQYAQNTAVPGNSANVLAGSYMEYGVT